MTGKVLVAYASKYGATTGIAEKIGDVLREEGLQVDVLPAKQVRDLSPYNAVVLGSAVYIGRWRKEAVRFLKSHETRLAEMPTWFFSSGPLGEGDAVELLDGWQFPPLQQAIADRIQPQGTVVFHGALDPQKMNAMEKWIMVKLESPVGEFRDWDAIEDWARSIAAALKDIYTAN